MILSIEELEAKSSFDEKEEELKDDMLLFSDDGEESLWVESRKESDYSRFNASEGESLLRSEFFDSYRSKHLSNCIFLKVVR